MIIYTAKLNRRRLAAGGLGALGLVCVLSLLFGFLGRTATAGEVISPKGVKTDQDRLAYLGAYGWLVKEEPLAVEELVIPEEMGQEYADYLELQTQQGFQLEKYAGKTVKRYTYEVLNYPTGETGVQASILLHKNTVVAAHVLSPALNGFIHGLQMPQSGTTGTSSAPTSTPTASPAPSVTANPATDTLADPLPDPAAELTTNTALQEVS